VKLLIDTHTFLWFVGDDPKLSVTARRVISDPNNDVYLSIASAWELAIKTSLGKITLAQPFPVFLPQQLRANSIRLLPIRMSHLQRVALLPFHHKAPFDRLLIAQSQAELMPLVSIDAVFDTYGVSRLW
jgi:PIN domain nuclease of toxin-antitoxin system